MLRVAGLNVTYESTSALVDLSLDVAPGSIVAVMGESGSGKTTLLRAIAGLVELDSGKISWDGRDITSTPTHQRGFGLMFQDYALFPHLNVAQNVAFGLRMRGADSRTQEEAVVRLLTLTGLEGFGPRSIAELSGGEQQRVALARTLAPEPKLVLLDEPLGALDRARRDQLLSDMQTIFGQLEVTALYVTHDHHEAFAFANRVVVLDEGARVAAGPPAEVWDRPRHIAVATLLGFPVLRDVPISGGRARLGEPGMALDLPDGTHHLALLPGAVTVGAGNLDAVVIARRFEEGRPMALIALLDVQVLAAAAPDVPLGPVYVRIDPSLVRAVEG